MAEICAAGATRISDDEETLTKKCTCKHGAVCSDMARLAASDARGRVDENLLDQYHEMCTQPGLPETSCLLYKFYETGGRV